MNFRPLFCLAAAVLLLTLHNPVLANGDDKDRARDFIQELASVTTETLQRDTRKELTLDAVGEFFKQHYFQRLDFNAIGAGVVGPTWRNAKTSDGDRKEFIETYKKWLLYSFSTQFLRFSKDKILVSKPDGIDVLRPSGDVIVPTMLVNPAGTRQVIAWRVTMTSAPKLVDVIIDKVSLLELHRAQFAKTLLDGGLKDLTKLISTRLAENTAK